MNTLYCNVGGSLHDTLHLDTLRTTGKANFEAGSIADVRRIIAHTGARYVMFALASLPRKAVAVDHPKLDSYIRRMLNPRPVKIVPHPQPVVTTVDDDIAELIDA